MKDIIQNKIEIRNEHWNRYQESWNEEKGIHEIDEPKEVDILGKEILDLLTENHKDLPVDFIIESLASLGSDASILNDDNGFYAIGSGGMGSVSLEPSDCHLSYFVEKRFWQPTIRLAIKSYFEDDEDDIDYTDLPF
jgi:hypothetical protein